MKFIKVIKSSNHDEFLKNTYKDYFKAEWFENQKFAVQITKDGYLQITMIKPYSMQERWPWAKSQQPLTIEEYEMLDQSGIVETNFDIYQVPERFEFHHPRAEWVSYIENGTQDDVFRELIELSKDLDYQVDRT